MKNAQDFKQYQSFPGVHGNPFDVILHTANRIQSIPAVGFIGILGLIAFLPPFQGWPYHLALLGFFLLDWLLVGLLPLTRRSFGPPQPAVLALSVLRRVVGFLPMQISVPLQIIGVFLVIYAFWLEPHTLKVTRQSLVSDKLPTGTRLKVLHLGDLHIERITRRERLLLQKIQALKPDVILFSGDILNLSNLRDPVSWQAAREVLSAWRAPGGVFLVSGSPAVDLEDVLPELLKGLPLTWLQNETVELSVQGAPVSLIGISCTHRPFADAETLQTLLAARAAQEPFTILLYHTPDLAPESAAAGVDLQLSGHTHGGQVRLPLWGALVTGSLYGKRFEAGRYSLSPLTLYVTRGLGMEGLGAPRVRFLCPPEIILWELSGKSQLPGSVPGNFNLMEKK